MAHLPLESRSEHENPRERTSEQPPEQEPGERRGLADAPAIEIDAPGGVNLDGATVVSSGPVTVASEPPSASPARAPGATSSQLTTPGNISLVGTTVRADPTQAPQAESLDDIPNGANNIYRATTEIVINGTTIRAQHGGDGLPFNKTSSTPLDVSGGTGGAGGNISISTPSGGIIRFVTSMGTSEFIPGDGAPGGPATATTTENAAVDPAPRARAFGGPGGDGGGVTILGAASITGDLNLIQWQVGIGGRGGNATATAADGVDADGSRGAQVGGTADAQAGFGGDTGATSGGFVGMREADNQEGGNGGIGRATAGQGGDGIRANPPGADGGESSAEGGSGGGGWGRAGNIGGDAIAAGGNGGMGADVCAAFADLSLTGQISVFSDPASSDQFIFGAGAGAALSLVYRILNALAGPGGDGGDGMFLSAVGGTGGSRLDTSVGTRGADGIAAVGAGGNGGDGGAGVPSGAGGDKGAHGAGSDTNAQQSAPVFQLGKPGGACGSAMASGTAQPLVAVSANQADQTIEIDGSGAWVHVTGVLSDTGTVTATGRGTVANVPNILVEFAGTWDATTETLTGTYTIDSEKVISALHPVVYSVSVAGG